MDSFIKEPSKLENVKVCPSSANSVAELSIVTSVKVSVASRSTLITLVPSGIPQSPETTIPTKILSYLPSNLNTVSSVPPTCPWDPIALSSYSPSESCSIGVGFEVCLVGYKGRSIPLPSTQHTLV